MKKMMSIRETAEEFGLSERYVRELVTEQKIAAVRSGRKYIVNTDSLNVYLDTQRAEPNPPSGKKTDKAKSAQFTPIGV